MLLLLLLLLPPPLRASQAGPTPQRVTEPLCGGGGRCSLPPIRAPFKLQIKASSRSSRLPFFFFFSFFLSVFLSFSRFFFLLGLKRICDRKQDYCSYYCERPRIMNRWRVSFLFFFNVSDLKCAVLSEVGITARQMGAFFFPDRRYVCIC